MVKTPHPGKFSLTLASVAIIALSGCGPQSPTTTQAPQNSVPTAPAAPTTPKSATPNSFDDVTAQLDSGGDLYFYLNTAQFLAKLTDHVDTFHDALLSGSNSGMSDDDRAQAEKAFAVAKDAITKSGIEDATGLGISSFALQPGFFRNKFFLHHYPDKGTGILWNLYGKDTHSLDGLDFMPADSGLASVGDFDLPLLINFLRQEAGQFPEAQQTITQWQTQFAGITGLQLDDVLNSLNGSLGMVLTLDGTSTITIPAQSPSQSPQTIPTPRLALLIAVKSDLIFKQIDKTVGANPSVIKADEPGLSMRTMAVPSPIEGLTLRPTVAQWNGFLVIASDDKLIRDMIAVQKGGPGLKSTSEFTTLSAGMPDKGNSFAFFSQRLADTIHDYQIKMLAGETGAGNPQTAAMQKLLTEYQNAAHVYGVSVRLPNGILSVSQGSQSSGQIIAPMIAVPAILAGVGLPAFSAARHHAEQTPPASSTP
jgi:hypothetical protein